ncbi:hypothetical protein C8Q73DRAFT_840499 [Cubamyces lactineus]|nr:hypothetical protein C8Q73DRAFT_840499 [Cubamyces lactineus]
MSISSHGDWEDTIPAPDVVARYVYNNRSRAPSLQSQMGVNGNREAVSDLTATTRIVAADYLELDSHSYREQRPETIETITKEVLRQHREVRKYRDGWPVSRYIHIFLKNYHPKKKSSGNRTKKANAVRGANRTSVSRFRPGPGRDSVGYIPPPGKAEAEDNKLNVAEQRQAQRHLAATPDVDAVYPAPASAPDSDFNPNLAPAVPQAAANIADVVPAFLSSIKFPAGDTEEITALFKKMGSENEVYLDIFAAMDTRDAWLRELCDGGELTPIQERVLREGLNKRAKENP